MSLATSSTEARPARLAAPVRQPPSFDVIERMRLARGLTVSEVVSRAGINYKTWWDVKRGAGAADPRRIRTLRRLAKAVEGGKCVVPPAAITALVFGAEEILRARITGDLLTACNPMRASRRHIVMSLPSARLRLLAIYLVAVEIEIENVDIANALGITREAVRKAREKVETLRDHDGVEYLFEVCGKLLTGRA